MYLRKLEPQTHRFISMSAIEFIRLKQEGKIAETVEGRPFVDENSNENMIEGHVNDSKYVQEIAAQTHPFGGVLSHFRPCDPTTNQPLKPLMIVGQDESAFSQFCVVPKQWVGTTGAGAIRPKSNGATIMVSAFQAQEFGLGLTLSANELSEINEKQRG